MRLFPVILLLLMVMTACVPAQPTQTAVQATALAIVYTAIAQTQTAQPTNTPLPPTITPTATIVYPTPSPEPTQPILVLTPGDVQIKKWREYEYSLGKKLLDIESSESQVLCEWVILGRSNEDVYVWAACMSPYKIVGTYPIASIPAVIHLDKNGNILGVDIPGDYAKDLPRLFPIEVRDKFNYLYSGEIKKMIEHLEWRRSHPEEPPLIVLSAVPFVTPTFTPASPPILTPNASQIERWREYQTALADAILIEYNYYPEDALCEWDILGHSGREVYVWAVCQNKFGDASIPAIIHLVSDESISAVEIPRTGSDYDSDVQGIFPKDIQAKFLSYYPYPFGRVWEMLKHIEWRQKHIEEPPLIILSATTVVPTP